jgi:D-alanyl-D-alanine carboxypeptidase
MAVETHGIRPQRVLRHSDVRFRFMRKLATLMSATLVLVTLVVVTLVVAMAPFAAHAQVGSERYSSLVIDAESGRVLSAANPDAERYPASLTKMMTLYLAFEALRDRRVTAAQLVPVSAHAASQAPSKLGLVPGMRLSVEQAILALVTKSANDAAAALGETLGGSEEGFAQMMTLRARALGMTHTTFRNASGLPDAEQVTTARDLAILARHLIQDFPDQYRYFSVPGFVFHGRMIPNHDHMLTTYGGADGIKTGYTEAAGHNLVTSAVRGDTRLIGVVLGASSNPERDQHMAALLDQGFSSLGVPGSGILLARASGKKAGGGNWGLIATAHAATLPPALRRPGGPPPTRLAAASRWHKKHAHLVHDASDHLSPHHKPHAPGHAGGAPTLSSHAPAQKPLPVPPTLT